MRSVLQSSRQALSPPLPQLVPWASTGVVAGLNAQLTFSLSPQKAQAEVEGLGKGVARLSEEAEKVLALPEPSPAAPTLRSELELTLGKLEQVRSLSAIYLEK